MRSVPKGCVVTAMVLLFLCVGCSDPSPVPRTALTSKETRMAKDHLAGIQRAAHAGKLEHADNLYLALRGEYPESQQVADAMLLLSAAHMRAREYLLARYYATAYLNDYPDGRRADQAGYLAIKSTFMRYKNSNSAEDLGLQVDQESAQFLADYRRSNYRVKVSTLIKEFRTIRKERNEDKAQVYERMNKPKAAEYYRNKKD